MVEVLRIFSRCSKKDRQILNHYHADMLGSGSRRADIENRRDGYNKDVTKNRCRQREKEQPQPQRVDEKESDALNHDNFAKAPVTVAPKGTVGVHWIEGIVIAVPVLLVLGAIALMTIYAVAGYALHS